MKTAIFLSAMLATGAAFAETEQTKTNEPLALNESQMDSVTAGVGLAEAYADAYAYGGDFNQTYTATYAEATPDSAYSSSYSYAYSK